MDAEEKIKLEIRLAALEYIMCKASAALTLLQTGSIPAAKAALARLGKEAGRQMFPNLDPVQSDMANDEWAQAVQRLAKIQIDFLEQVEKGLK